MGTIHCDQCQSMTTTKRVTVPLQVTKYLSVPASARIQVCTSCGHQFYGEKEQRRLRELLHFYKKEQTILEEEEHEVSAEG